MNQDKDETGPMEDEVRIIVQFDSSPVVFFSYY